MKSLKPGENATELLVAGSQFKINGTVLAQVINIGTPKMITDAVIGAFAVDVQLSITAVTDVNYDFIVIDVLSMFDASSAYNTVNDVSFMARFSQGFAQFGGILMTASDKGVLALTKKTNYLTRGIGGAYAANSAFSADRTYHTEIEISGDFVAVKLGFESIEAASWTISKIGVAVSDGSVAFPSFSGSLIAGTFNGGSASGVFPAGGSVYNPLTLESDWTFMPSVERVDKPSAPKLLIARAYISATGGTGSGLGYSFHVHNNKDIEFDNDPNQRRWKTANQGGGIDGVGTPASFTNATPINNSILAYVKTMTTSRAITVLFSGDSCSAGTKSSGNCTGFGYLACKSLSTNLLPIEANVIAIPSSLSQNYYDRLIAYLAVNKPDIAFIQISSINDPCNSSAKVDLHFKLAMLALSYCWANDIYPVLQTPYPQNQTEPSEGYRKALIVKIMAAVSKRNGSGLCLLDVNSLLADPLNPGKYLPIYNSGDNSHPNNVGYALLATKAAEIIRFLTGA